MKQEINKYVDRRKIMKNRRDGILVNETDPMQALMPYLHPNRTDNEAVMNEKIDLTAICSYLEKKNADSPDYKYTFFHVICAAIAKTISLRPRMNRFYAGYKLYDRKDISLSFVVKRQFEDDSDEVLAIVKVDKESSVSPIEQIYEKTKKIVYSARKEYKTDGATDKMAILTKMPRWLLKIVMRTLSLLDYYDKYPKSFMEVDPYYTTVFISNLGSIKMHASYHHLANWGTNSIFVVIGEKKLTPFYNPDGSYQLREALNLGITVDERIADGYYFSKSIRILRKLLENPELLDSSINTEVDV